MSSNSLRLILMILSSASLLGYGFFAWIIYAKPSILEKTAESFIIQELEKEIPEVKRLAKYANGSYLLKNKILVYESRLPLIGKNCNNIDKKSCAKEERITNKASPFDNLSMLIQNRRTNVFKELKQDLQIFFTCNFLILASILLLTLFKSKLTHHLQFPFLLIFISTIVSSIIYIFGHSWLYSIIYNDYMGYGYLLYVGVISTILCDIAFNKAKITAVIVNSISSILGTIISPF